MIRYVLKILWKYRFVKRGMDFSLDELVKKLAAAFENKALADILKMNLQLTQEFLLHRIFNIKSFKKIEIYP